MVKVLLDAPFFFEGSRYKKGENEIVSKTGQKVVLPKSAKILAEKIAPAPVPETKK